MQSLRLDEPGAATYSLGVALGARSGATATLLEALEYLSSLQGQLWRAARNVPTPLPDGASPALVRIRRARQAAAIQSAVNVLQELAREASPPLPDR